MTVAALFVSRRGPYWNRPGVDAWDEKRDARKYDGLCPVVAHPPCGRWCRLAKFVEQQHGLKVGDDGGCFASALANVRRCGGVLEHPAFSLAWRAFDLTPPAGRGWLRTFDDGWVCEVSQTIYGHRASKPTWLYYVGETPPAPLDWRSGVPTGSISGCRKRMSPEARARRPRIWGAEASRTPDRFADALLELARHSKGCAR